MKRIAILILMSLFLSSKTDAKTVYNWERWQDADDKQPYPTEYKGFKPPTYFMQPTDRTMTSRYYSDYYSLEDHSGYEDPCSGATASTDCIGADDYYGRRTDIPLEVYYDKVLNDGPSGLGWTKSGGGAELAVSGYQTYDKRSDGSKNAVGKQRVNITLQNMAPRDALDDPIMTGIGAPSDLFPRYSLRNIGGLLYRAKFECDTNVTHVAYDSNDVEQRMSGQLGTVSDNEYCFFIFLPKSKVQTASGNVEIGPFIGRASVSGSGGVTPHALSQKYIEAGLVPLMDLKDDLKALLVGGTDPSLITYVQGRYMVPLKMGDILLPQNGANAMYFRMFANRPYHQDRREKKVTKSKGSLALIAFIVVGIFTFGVGLAIGLAVTATLIAVSLGAGAIAAFLLKDSAYDRTVTGAAGGQKRNTDLGNSFYRWPGNGTDDNGPQHSYLSLHSREGAALVPYQDGTKTKQFVAAFTALEEVAEADLLKQLRTGTIDFIEGTAAVPTTVSGPVNKGYLTHPSNPSYPSNVKDPSGAGFWKSDEALSDGRYFQIMKAGGYSVTGGESFTPGSGTGIITVPCSSLVAPDPVKVVCDKHMAMIDALEAFYFGAYGVADYTYSSPNDGITEFSGRLYGASDTVTDGVRIFPSSTEYKDLMSIFSTYESDINVIDQNMATAQAADPAYINFFKFTDEGSILANRMTVMQPALGIAAGKYARDWFAGGQEVTVLQNRISNAITNPVVSGGCEPAAGWVATIILQTLAPAEIAAAETCIEGKAHTLLTEYNAMEADAAIGLPFITYTTHICEGQQTFLPTLSALADLTRHNAVAPANDYKDYITAGDECTYGGTLVGRAKNCYMDGFVTGFETTLPNSPDMAEVEKRSEIPQDVPTTCP
ncbi:MAG: hypothetical protein COB02_11915 [Candidatus Cloacimonadota bacterium]|nr:MAG: hypothetical protein COB02_11915 [Candidatus Cloacimonadota bacterium]